MEVVYKLYREGAWVHSNVMTDTTYVPGMCNINTAEVAYRRKAMWFGIGLSAAAFIALIALSAAWWIGAIALFVPVYIAAINFLQVRNRFCVSYGGSGKQNADEGSLEAHVVTDNDAVLADKRKARRMNLQALCITLITLFLVTLVLYVV